MPYRVALVDDEYWALTGLLNCYDWAGNGFIVAFTSTDPAEALDIIKADPPDVVFTDICMDEVDGLKMIAALKCERRIKEYVIVSGYDDFEFAKRSIQLGVFDYLLKPIEREEMRELMERLKFKLRQGSALEKEDSAEEPVSHERLNQMLNYIEQNYHRPITLGSLAAQFYFTETYVCDLFRKYLHKTFSVFLREVRIERAKKILSTSKLSISEVAQSTGYSDVGYFTRVFKRMTGVTPQEYRASTSGSVSKTDV